LNLNAEDITIQSVHPSIIGQDTWFQITYTSSGTTRYFSCQSPKERDEWIASLKKTLMMNEDRRRTDNSLRIDVLEVKGLSEKKKYYAEILVDDKLYARTSAKKLTSSDSCCFWGEQFEFKDLPQNADKIGLLIHKEKSSASTSITGGGGKRKKAKKPVGRVKISIQSVKSRYVQDKWYAVEKSSRRDSPSIRLRCQFSSVDILPLRDYEEFLYFLRDEYKALGKMLEPNISVKVKEELAISLMNVFHAEEMAEDVLADIVVDEISAVDNEHLTFRGNSIATKAMESYIKLVGQKYLHDTLRSVIDELINSDLNLEIDPIKVATGKDAATAAEALTLHRQQLMTVVKQIWQRISNSHSYFPITLQRCFYKIRQYLQHVGKPDVGDNLISSCIFLRYICPAILAPSLFNLTEEFPGERANRNLTLVAKTLQTLANFTKYEGKENSMEFLNTFIEGETTSMRTFLRQISSPLAEDGWIPALSTNGPPSEKSDLGRHLSCLHTILFENISKIPEKGNPKAERLRQLLDDINSILNRPSTFELNQISRTTMETVVERQQSREKPESSRISQDIQRRDSGVTSNGSNETETKKNWLGRLSGMTNTLPKKDKSKPVATQGGPTNPRISIPAPCHKQPGTMTYDVDSIDDTSSSSITSLTPSPGAPAGRQAAYLDNKHLLPNISGKPAQRKGGIHIGMSTISLDDTSSDDSTYSSQHPSDGPSSSHTPVSVGQQSSGGSSNSHTLPRHLGGQHTSYPHSRIPTSYNTMGNANHAPSKSLSDYENEILMLRSEMEQLQIKLGEAESKLQLNAHQNRTSVVLRAEEDARQVVGRLLKEEDLLRRGPLDPQNLALGDKEKMIQMQQQKIASLDETNSRLIEELNRLGEKLSSKQIGGGSSIHLRTQPPSSSIPAFGGTAPTLVSVTTSPSNYSVVGDGGGSGQGGATTITSINMTPNSLSTSPHPSSSSSCSGPRRFGSPSSTISSSSSVSSASAHGHHQSSIPVKSPNRSITVISNGQTAFIPPNASSGVSSVQNGGNTTTLTLPIGDSPSKQLATSVNNAVSTSNNTGMRDAVQETPKTVDELLDSLHSTPI